LLAGLIFGVSAQAKTHKPAASACPSASATAQAGAGSFRICGLVSQPQIVPFIKLASLPQQTLQVSFTAGTATQTHTEQGPLLTDVLALAGPKFNSQIKNHQLRFYVQATGSDGYAALVSYGEIDPGFGNKKVILSISEDGHFLTSTGPRLIVPGDIKGGRYVSGVVAIYLGQAPAQLPIPTS
jgi:hypothetical protein